MNLAHSSVKLNPSDGESFSHFIKDNGAKTLFIILVFVLVCLLITVLIARSNEPTKQHKVEAGEDD